MAQSIHRSSTTEGNIQTDGAVPPPREEPTVPAPREIAAAGIAALAQVGEQVQDAVDRISDVEMHRPSALAGWTRAHLVSHLARNADALCNLLAWARTDVEQHAYASDEDRDADIVEGAERLPRVIREDLAAANARFMAAAHAMPERGWRTMVTNRQGNEFGGYLIPWVRVMEEVVHLVDLDMGYTFDDIAELSPDILGPVIEVVIGSYRNIPGTPLVRARVDFGRSTGEYTLGADGPEHQVSGRPADVLGWLTGRTDGSRLDGDLPALPAWLR